MHFQPSNARWFYTNYVISGIGIGIGIGLVSVLVVSVSVALAVSF